MEIFAKNFATLRELNQCSDVALNRIGSEEIVQYEMLKKLILRMAHESGLSQNDKCPAEWNLWPEDFGLPSSRNTGIGTKATREALVAEIALATSNNIKSASTFGEGNQAASANRNPAKWAAGSLWCGENLRDTPPSSHAANLAKRIRTHSNYF